jgi:hypothetical protein
MAKFAKSRGLLMRFDRLNLKFGLLLAVMLTSVILHGVAQAKDTSPYEDQYVEQFDYKPSPIMAKVFDVAVVRPVMLGVTAFGLAAFVGSLPFTATGVAGIDIPKARENFLMYPFNYTFRRPLGDFSEQE